MVSAVVVYPSKANGVENSKVPTWYLFQGISARRGRSWGYLSTSGVGESPIKHWLFRPGRLEISAEYTPPVVKAPSVRIEQVYTCTAVYLFCYCEPISQNRKWTRETIIIISTVRGVYSRYYYYYYYYSLSSLYYHHYYCYDRRKSV